MKGHFGNYGGQFVPETLMHPLEELEAAYVKAQRDPAFQAQMDNAAWPDLKKKFDTLFRTRTRDEWCALMEGANVCFAPVLDLEEAPWHPHNVTRETFTDVNGVMQPSPAPRFSRTVPEIQGAPPEVGEHNDVVLTDTGFTPEQIAGLKRKGAIWFKSAPKVD